MRVSSPSETGHISFGLFDEIEKARGSLWNAVWMPSRFRRCQENDASMELFSFLNQ